MQLPTSCMGTNQVQVEAFEDRPRPTAWDDGVGKGPIIKDAASGLCKARHAFIRERRFCRVVWRHKKRQSDCIISQEYSKVTTRGE
jgi:hypothetical protein